MMPILGLRVIKAEFHAVFGAGGRQLSKRVALERRGVINIVTIDFAMKHGKAVVMLGGDDHVFHARRLSERHPLLGVEFFGIKLLGVTRISGDGDFGVVHDPFAEAGDLLAVVTAGRHGIDAPVDEHAEAGGAPPFHAGVALFLRFGRLRCRALRKRRRDRHHY